MASLRHTLKNFFGHKAIVLMYHRVADAAVDPWNLAVSPQYFNEQIAQLAKNFTVVPVPELIKNLQQKKLAANSVSVTFDDGYADNYLFAKPILERYGCPATFFIPSHYIGQQQPFWWDSLEALLLTAPQLPQLFQITIQDEPFYFDLEADAVLTPQLFEKHKAWRWPDAAPTRRCALYLKIWEQLKPLQLAEITTIVEDIKEWANQKPVFSDVLTPMDSSKLLDLGSNALFTIGLHTATHPALAYHPEELQYAEIAENKKALRPYAPVNAVAFPYGNYNNSTLAVLHKQRIDAAFTTEERSLTAKSNLHCLGRFQVKNWNGLQFEKQLRQWLKG